ncbi:unnamed protein product [Schistosoma margrebowiei]|uniref:Uncharacterized protein n=1 Tax=Schistosoma margrebowiei TaxID=48269 RepID=A0AA85A9C0_9TREM|nr:unnamed protein product [Schistosoma margrebowiei]
MFCCFIPIFLQLLLDIDCWGFALCPLVKIISSCTKFKTFLRSSVACLSDVIIIKPGQTIFAFCKQINENHIYFPGDVYVPQKLSCNLISTSFTSIQKSDESVVAVVIHSPLASYLDIASKSRVENGYTFQPLAYKVVNTAVWVSLIIKCSITFIFLTSIFICALPIGDLSHQFYRLQIWFAHTLGIVIASSSFSLYFIWMVATAVVTFHFQNVLSNAQDHFKLIDGNNFKSPYVFFQPNMSKVSKSNTLTFHSLISNLRCFGFMVSKIKLVYVFTKHLPSGS